MEIATVIVTVIHTVLNHKADAAIHANQNAAIHANQDAVFAQQIALTSTSGRQKEFAVKKLNYAGMIASQRNAVK